MKKLTEDAYTVYNLLIDYTERVDKLIEKLQKEQERIFIKINKLNEDTQTVTDTDSDSELNNLRGESISVVDHLDELTGTVTGGKS